MQPLSLRPFGSVLLVQTIPPVEPLDTSSGIDHFLLTRIERMACGTNFNLEVFRGGLGFDHIAARAMDFTKLIIRMNPFLHNKSSSL
jgi:hypothetical protein